MNKKRKMMIAGGICAVVLIAAAAVLFTVNGRKNAGADGDVAAGDDSSSVKNEDGENGESGTAADDGGAGESSSSGSAGTVTDGTAADDGGAGESSSSGSAGTVTDGGSVQQGEDVFFPYVIVGTELTVQNISSYDGIFLEDGSDGEVTGVAAMVVENTGDTNVEYAAITISCNGETLEFDASDLPSGATVVVQEKNKTPYQSGTYTDCSAVVAEMGDFEMSEDQVKVEETESGSLLVTNLTDEEIPCVRIFYKFYMADEETYVGGITYTAKLTGLSAGASQTVTPSHYAAGNSRIMMVRTYDSTE